MTPLVDGLDYLANEEGEIFKAISVQTITSDRYSLPVTRVYKQRKLKPYLNKRTGYYMVGITMPTGKRKCCLVHRLIAKTFIPNPDNLPEVNHINLDKTDNRVSNLEWCSREENLKHAEANGMKRIGETVGTSILKEEDVLQITKLLEEGVPQTTIGHMFGVSNHAIWRIAHGHNWSWLTKISRKEGE